MDYIPNCFSEKLSKLPGKTDKDQNTWLRICCIIKVPKVADQKWRMLHLQIGEKCRCI